MEITPAPDRDITLLLQRWSEGDEGNRDRLMAQILPELKRIAGAKMRQERFNHTLQPTALVSELYIYLVSRQKVNWQNRAHFLAVCSEAMRRILVDHARSKHAEKRGGSVRITDMEGIDAVASNNLVDVLIFDQLLEQLAQKDERMAKIVELRFFGGLTNDEVAEVVGIHARTVKRGWEVARAWLFGQLRKSKDDEPTGLGAG